MLAFVVRRALEAILVMLVVALIAFSLFRFVGDPINQMVGLETSFEERDKLRQALGLNDSVLIQFVRFVWHALHFDFGEGLLEIGLVLSSLYFIARRKLFPTVGIVAGVTGAVLAAIGLLI